MQRWRFAIVVGLLAAASPGQARAAGPFVDAPLVLPPLRFSADVGLGFGTVQSAPVGGGTSLAAAIGLPFLGELGVRVGYRFDDSGIAGNADHFARLFDPIVSEPGASQLTNPEIRLLGGLIGEQVFQLGLETRVIIPTDPTTDANGQRVSSFAVTPGVPMRIHVPGFLRIDTGLYLPLAFNSTTSYALDVPAQAFFAGRGRLLRPRDGRPLQRSRGRGGQLGGHPPGDRRGVYARRAGRPQGAAAHRAYQRCRMGVPVPGRWPGRGAAPAVTLFRLPVFTRCMKERYNGYPSRLGE